MPSYLTAREAAEYLGLSTSTIYKLAERGEVPAGKVGGSWRFSREALDRFIGIRPLSREPIVLVVDPDPLARLRLAQAVQRRVAHVQALPDAGSALTAAEMGEPDIIFFSPRPGPSGEAAAFLQALEGKGLRSRVVFVVGVSEFSEVADALKSGPVWVLRKPIEQSDVMLMLNSITR
jgi:excisionase family DNA binding protein